VDGIKSHQYQSILVRYSGTVEHRLRVLKR